jgi:uncharacterized protein YjbJ (UPF0337 family)
MGAMDEAKGKAKEAVGDVTGSEGLRDEGQAQQHKGAHEREASEARAEAERHEAAADTAERDERGHQGT